MLISRGGMPLETLPCRGHGGGGGRRPATPARARPRPDWRLQSPRRLQARRLPGGRRVAARACALRALALACQRLDILPSTTVIGALRRHHGALGARYAFRHLVRCPTPPTVAPHAKRSACLLASPTMIVLGPRPRARAGDGDRVRDPLRAVLAHPAAGRAGAAVGRGRWPRVIETLQVVRQTTRVTRRQDASRLASPPKNRQPPAATIGLRFRRSDGFDKADDA